MTNCLRISIFVSKDCFLSCFFLRSVLDFFRFVFAIIPTEHHDNWIWFLKNLKMVVLGHRKLTFITDRHWGLINGIHIVFPSWPRVFSVFHLKKNLHCFIDVSIKKRKWIMSLSMKCVFVATFIESDKALEEFKVAGGTMLQSFWIICLLKCLLVFILLVLCGGVEFKRH